MNINQLPKLTIGVSGFAERVDGTPVKESDWTDMAQAMGKCTPEQQNLLRSVYLHDLNAMRRLTEKMARTTCRIEHAGLLSRDLAYTTIRAFAAMRPCGHCDGEGRVRMPDGMLLDIDTGEWESIKGGWKQCSWCRGDGYSHVQPDAVRTMMGVSPQVWEMLLAQPFTEAYEQVRQWYRQAEQAISSA